MAELYNRIDGILADGPKFAGYGALGVGVRSEVLAFRDQALEVWYPADCDSALTSSDAVYDTLLRDGVTQVRLFGRAHRGAKPLAGDWPLVILSHGYPGNRLLLSHLGETLASRGYLVASIDHRGSTYADKRAFVETLVNRPLDTRAVADHFDAQAYAIIGYSMGGYGALVAGGACVSAVAVADHGAVLAQHQTIKVDPRLRAIIPLGPWGGKQGIWEADGLAAVSVPTFIMAGSADEISGYDTGMRRIFNAVSGARLLTFEGAGHNAAAPIPAPREALTTSPALEFLPAEHYADPVWDTVRMNAIAQHFATAFLGLHLKGDAGMAAYLEGFEGFSAQAKAGLRLEP